MHSAPDLVVRAHWNGAVARSTAVANCWEIVRATNRRMMSPTLTPPDASAVLSIVRDAPRPQSHQDVSGRSSCLKVPRQRRAWPPQFFVVVQIEPRSFSLTERWSDKGSRGTGDHFAGFWEGLQCGIRSPTTLGGLRRGGGEGEGESEGLKG